MMRRWMTTVLLGMILLGCQFDPDLETSGACDAPTACVCVATAPPAIVYTGGALPPTSATEVWIVTPPAIQGKASAMAIQGESMAALVDTNAATIRSVLIVSANQRVEFLSRLFDEGHVVISGPTPPPPPVVDPILFAAYGVRAAEVSGLAAADAKQCMVKP